MTKVKDLRKTFKGERIAVNGTFVSFDGKLDTVKNELRIYQLFGDVSLFDEAIQNFCIDNKIDKASTKLIY